MADAKRMDMHVAKAAQSADAGREIMRREAAQAPQFRSGWPCRSPCPHSCALLSSLRQGCAAQLLLRTKQALAAKDANLTEFRMNTGRLVIVRLIPMPSRTLERPAPPAPRSQVGDTHGQLNDFCWILRSHGHPAPGNVYLINGDVADRGRFTVPLAYESPTLI